jgi:hypothetical protein
VADGHADVHGGRPRGDLGALVTRQRSALRCDLLGFGSGDGHAGG